MFISKKQKIIKGQLSSEKSAEIDKIMLNIEKTHPLQHKKALEKSYYGENDINAHTGQNEKKILHRQKQAAFKAIENQE